MIKKLILSILVVVNFFATNAAIETWRPSSLNCLPVAVGDFDAPLVPYAHCYHSPQIDLPRFSKVISTPSGYIIFSIQHLSDCSTREDTEQKNPIQFKPQWSIARGLPDSFYYESDDKYDIGIQAHCNIRVIDSEKENEIEFTGYFNFHKPESTGTWLVSPDVMPLGFDGTSSLSKVIEYDVKYTTGQGSDFAKLKSGTCQKGIILLLNDEDMEKFAKSGLEQSPAVILLAHLHDFLKNISVISGNESLKSKLGLA